MGFPIRGAQADCGTPGLFCDADQNSVLVTGVLGLGGEENRAFEKGSPELWMYAMPRCRPWGALWPDA